jgi:hypothetical protein
MSVKFATVVRVVTVNENMMQKWVMVGVGSSCILDTHAG